MQQLKDNTISAIALSGHISNGGLDTLVSSHEIVVQKGSLRRMVLSEDVLDFITITQHFNIFVKLERPLFGDYNSCWDSNWGQCCPICSHADDH
jgi:hypothetical protein